MRFRDASHVDLGSFYARRPALGRLYRLSGYGACVWVLWFAQDIRMIGAMLVLLLVMWVMAWYREVGALFRAPLVAAIAMAAVLITADRLDHPLHPRPSSAPAREPRQIELRVDAAGPTGQPPPSVLETTK